MARLLRWAVNQSTHPLYRLHHVDDATLFRHTVDASGRCSRDALDRLPLWRSDPLLLHSVPLPPGTPRRPRNEDLSPQEDRAFGAVMGMAVGDAIGAPIEFLSYRPTGCPPSLGIDGAPLPGAEVFNKFSLRQGQWTDDTALGLCLLDSLISANGAPLSPADLLLRFCAWWWSGYNNAFGELHSQGRMYGAK